MIKKIIDKAIRTEGIIEMDYSKDGVTSKFYQLCKIRYSDKYKNYISGTPLNFKVELTFRIDRIKELQLMWDFVFEENLQFEKSGIYLLSFMGDNHIEYGLDNYDKGEKLLDHNRFDLWAIQAYHYIPYYSEIKKNQWHFFDKSEKVKEDSIYVFAYTINQGGGADWEDRPDFLLTKDNFNTTEHSGIHYTAIRVRKGHNIENQIINNGLNIIAYNRCSIYSYENLGVHNDIRLGLKL